MILSMLRLRNRRPAGRKRVGTIAIFALISLYIILQPRLNDRFGLNLPGLENHPVAVDTDAPGTDSEVALDSPDQQDVAVASDATSKSTMANQSAAETATEAPSDSALRFGILREIRPERYLSPQGLNYGPGSAEGHRLEHLRRHTEDQPSRPGEHGVFDGGMVGALKTIDSAYERAKKQQRTTKQTDRDRTIYTVDMGRRVGYVGGRDGNRMRKPMARRVKLVLEGTNVITAFPL